MASIINASTASGGGVITSADASGVLQLQTGSTTAITIDASQNVVLANGLTVGATAAPAFSAYMSATQSLVASTFVKIQYNAEEFDTNNNYDNTTNYRFTPTVAGYYQLNGYLQLAGSGVGYAELCVYKNGVPFKNGPTQPNFPAIGVNVNISVIVFANGSTDYFELYGYQNSGGALSTRGTIVSTNYFQAFLARSA